MLIAALARQYAELNFGYDENDDYDMQTDQDSSPVTDLDMQMLLSQGYHSDDQYFVSPTSHANPHTSPHATSNAASHARMAAHPPAQIATLPSHVSTAEGQYLIASHFPSHSLYATASGFDPRFAEQQPLYQIPVNAGKKRVREEGFVGGQMGAQTQHRARVSGVSGEHAHLQQQPETYFRAPLLGERTLRTQHVQQQHSQQQHTQQHTQHAQQQHTQQQQHMQTLHHHHQLPGPRTHHHTIDTVESSSKTREEDLAPSMVGQEGMPAPAPKPRGPKLKFTRADDALLVELKEAKHLTWKQIADFFPGRTSGTLQVRYCTKLKAKTSVWSDEMVDRLRTAMAEYDNDRWRVVASKVGNGFSASACREKALELDGEGEGDDTGDVDDLSSMHE